MSSVSIVVKVATSKQHVKATGQKLMVKLSQGMVHRAKVEVILRVMVGGPEALE